jgi:8-oxo-dGTP pyrophosphatase MutT (NUDIX family)
MIEVLLISSRKHPGSWVFPVGSVDKDETPRSAACRECREETGFVAGLGAPLDPLEALGMKRPLRFLFYLAEPIDEVPLQEADRQLRWVPLDDLVAGVPHLFRPIADAAVRLLTAEFE